MTYAADPKRVLSAALAAMFAVAASPAFAMTDQPASQDAAADFPASLIAFDQKPKGKSVAISYVRLPQNGYVAIFADENGKRSDKVLGFTALDKGNHNNVTVDVGADLKPGSAMWATLYKDVDGDKALDTKKDVAFWPEGEPLENRFKVE
ncbi:DUF7282 domain-containing protein [Hyphomicrobium sp.]|uniref:DUF7282 domain-containing protein n=1 Tax=Hyphomicrobium sp. TaxID=82 RepID=UPI002D79C5CB|nr:hypothetical protein [Hyphomicrobium sp.]HET6390162.1 hypothetical protein [Hyphomicrobium sp.]